MGSSTRRAEILLFVAVLALVILAVFGGPLAQQGDYHHFADQRSLAGIPNALDVLSNLSFALCGLAGLLLLGRVPAAALERTQRALAALFFVGLLLIALGSSWYHWRPDDAGLAVDRLCMAIAFAGLLGLGAACRISARAGMALALSLLVLAPVSVGIWVRAGNLLPWALVQGGGMLMLLVLVGLRPRPGALGVRWWLIVALYAVAKLAERADVAIFDLSGQLLSGHSLKHLIAALAALPVVVALLPLVQNAPGRAAPARHA